MARLRHVHAKHYDHCARLSPRDVPAAAWCDYGAVVHRELGIPASHILLSGMALWEADMPANENTLISDHAGAEEFATWHR